MQLMEVPNMTKSGSGRTPLFDEDTTKIEARIPNTLKRQLDKAMRLSDRPQAAEIRRALDAYLNGIVVASTPGLDALVSCSGFRDTVMFVQQLLEAAIRNGPDATRAFLIGHEALERARSDAKAQVEREQSQTQEKPGRKRA